MLFSQNLTTKCGFMQKFTPKSDRILEKVHYFLKMAVFDTLNGIPKFPFQSKKKKKPLIPCFLGHTCLQYYTSSPLPPPGTYVPTKPYQTAFNEHKWCLLLTGFTLAIFLTNSCKSWLSAYVNSLMESLTNFSIPNGVPSDSRPFNKLSKKKKKKRKLKWTWSWTRVYYRNVGCDKSPSNGKSSWTVTSTLS